jgi:hypothetical protein
VLDSGIVLAVLAVFSFAFGVAGVIGSWRVARNSTIVTQYRETALAWEAKAKVQDVEIADLKTADTANVQRIAELTGKVAVLQDTLTGKMAWDVLDRKLAEALELAASTRAEIRALGEQIARTGK